MANNPSKRNIPIFGPERSAFLEVLRQYSGTKVAYDGAIYNYQQSNYDMRLLDGYGGTVPVRVHFSLSRVLMEFNILEGTDEAIGFEFDIPIRRGYEVDMLIELWPWDYSKRLASVEVKNAYFNSQEDYSKQYNLFFDQDPMKNEYVYLTVVLNKEMESDFNNKETYLQSKILNYFEDQNRDFITRRLFNLRVKQIVRNLKSQTEEQHLETFDCRDDSVVIEIGR